MHSWSTLGFRLVRNSARLLQLLGSKKRKSVTIELLKRGLLTMPWSPSLEKSQWSGRINLPSYVTPHVMCAHCALALILPLASIIAFICRLAALFSPSHCIPSVFWWVWIPDCSGLVPGRAASHSHMPPYKAFPSGGAEAELLLPPHLGILMSH